MNYWEFLIQKEGDDTWLPLETQQVEVLEGRYRIVGHTDRTDTPVEIRVSQLITSEMPARSRVRKRIAKINDAGLVVIMPYMHLQPGQWEITCSGFHPTDDSPHANWQYQVQLQVFAQMEENDYQSEQTTPDSASSRNSSGEKETAARAEADATDTPAASQDKPLSQALTTLQSNLERQGLPSWQMAATPESPYQICLQQQAFLAKHDQAMVIAGQVQALSPKAFPVREGSQLWLRLQNPETAAVIMEAHRPLGLDRLPASFQVKIQLPATIKTRIILGEVSLRAADSADSQDSTQILSTSSFTITAGIDQLIDKIASTDLGNFEEFARPSESDLAAAVLDPTRTAPAPAIGVVSPHLSPHRSSPLIVTDGVHNITAVSPPSVAPSVSPAPSVSSSSSVPLSSPVAPSPPVPSPEPQSAPSLRQEPKAPTPEHQKSEEPVLPLPPMVTQPARFMATSIEDDDIETSQIAALLEDIDGDLASQSGDISTLEPPGIEAALPTVSPADSHLGDELDPDLDRETAFTCQADQALAEHEDDSRSLQQTKASLAFKSLKLKDHFWQRLCSLTHESHEEALQLAEDMKAAGVSRTASSPGNSSENGSGNSPYDASSLPAFRAEQRVDLPANGEVVIYDPAPPTAGAPLATPDSQPSLAKAVPAPSPSPALPTPPSSVKSFSSDLSTGFSSSLSSNGSSSPSTGLPSSPSPGLPSDLPSASASLPNYADLPEVELPVISVPVGDLIAGGTVTITVRIRPSVYKPFIKLWMIDRQSRTLVGEPQLLTSLRPDTLGYLETSASLQVPMGCLDVQIAAIAVDMATQQESNKAIVNRHVVPVNQPSGSLRNFNF